MPDDFVDPMEAATRFRPPLPPQAPGSTAVDPMEASTRLGGKGPLNTSFKELPSATSPGTPWEQFGREVGMGTRNVIEGVSALPASIYDLAAVPQNALNWGVKKATGYDLGLSTKPGSERVGQAMDYINRDVMPGSLPKPETDAEKLRAEFIRGGSAMMTPMGLSAAAPKLVGSLPSLVQPFVSMNPGSPLKAAEQVAAGGTGAVVGDKLAESSLVHESLKPTVRLAGNIAGGGGTNMLASGVERAYNALSGIKNPIAAALERLGITPTTAGQVSEGTGMKSAERTLQDTSFGSGTIRPAQEDFQSQFGKAVETTARDAETASPGGQAGKFVSNQTTGVGVQNAARNWKENILPVEEAKRWDPVNNVMQPAGAVVDASGYLTALREAVNNPALAGMPATQQTMARTQLQKWLTSLENDTANGTKKIDWEAARALKQEIWDAMETPDLVNSIGNNRMMGLYGSLAQDMKVSAILKGVGKEFDAANTYSTATRAFQNNTLSKVISGKNAVGEPISATDATKALMAGNSEDWQSLRQMIPEAADALAAFKLRQMKEAPLSRQMADSTPSSEAFLSDLRGSQLEHPEGTAALFSNPKVAPQVQDLAALAEQIRRIRMSNPLPSGLKTALSATVVAPWLAAKAITNPATIAMTGARRAAPPPVPGLLGGALVNQATGQPARYDIDVRPQPQ